MTFSLDIRLGLHLDITFAANISPVVLNTLVHDDSFLNSDMNTLTSEMTLSKVTKHTFNKTTALSDETMELSFETLKLNTVDTDEGNIQNIPRSDVFTLDLVKLDTDQAGDLFGQ